MEFVHQICQLQPFTHSLVSNKQHWGEAGVVYFFLSLFSSGSQYYHNQMGIGFPR